MWKMSLVWYEFIIRSIIVYMFLIVLLRLTGKRQVGSSRRSISCCCSC